MNSNFPRFRYEGCVYMHVWGREAERQAGEGGGEPGGDSIHTFGERFNQYTHGGARRKREGTFSLDDIIPQSV